MHAVAGQCIQEYGQRGHERLTFTCCHLGYLALVQHDAAEELHVVVHHLPFQVVAACRPVVVVDGLVAVDGDEVLAGVGGQLAVEVVGRDDGLLVLGEAAGGLLHNGEHLGHHLVQGRLVHFERLFLQLVYLGKDVGALVKRRALDGCLQFCNLLFLLCGGGLHLLPDFLCACSQSVVVESLYFGRLCFHALHERLYEFHVA